MTTSDLPPQGRPKAEDAPLGGSKPAKPAPRGGPSLPQGRPKAEDAPVFIVDSWHAHVYFDSATRDTAFALRERIAAAFGATVEVGRFHERPVGPHPRWSYQVAFTPDVFADVATWLALNHGELDVFLHPNTGDALSDHRDRAIWIGHSHVLDLRVLGG